MQRWRSFDLSVLGQLTCFVSLTRARGRERGLAVVTGSLAHAIGRAKTAGGLGRASLRLFLGAWLPEKSGAAKFRFIGFAGAMLLEAIGPAGRCSGGVVLIYRFRANLPVLSALRAREGESVVWPLLRGRSPTRSVAPKQQGGSGVFLSGLRARAERGLAC